MLEEVTLDNYNSLNDFLFYKYMCEEGNERQQKIFLEAIGVPINGVLKVLNQTIASETIVNKKCILDFLGETNDSFINLELQRSKTSDFNERIAYYMSRIVNLKKGKVYTEFKDVVLVSVVNFKMNDLPDYKHEYMFINTKNLTDIFTDKIKLIVIELEKFQKIKKDLDNKEHQYLMFFDEETDHKTRKELGKMDEGLRASVKKIEEALQDDNAVRIYHKLEWQKMLEENEKIRMKKEREKGKKEGIKEGKEKGIKKGKEEGIREGIEKGKKEGIREGRKKGIREGREKGKKEGIMEGIEKGKKEGIREGIEKGIREGKKEGIREGKKEGIREGIEKGRKEAMEIANVKFAIKLKKAGFSVEEIAKLTDLTKEVIERL